jgi:hypothetical protein
MYYFHSVRFTVSKVGKPSKKDENSPSSAFSFLMQESKKVVPSGRVQEHLCRENSPREEKVHKQKQQRPHAGCAPSVGSMTVESEGEERKR